MSNPFPQTIEYRSWSPEARAIYAHLTEQERWKFENFRFFWELSSGCVHLPVLWLLLLLPAALGMRMEKDGEWELFWRPLPIQLLVLAVIGFPLAVIWLKLRVFSMKKHLCTSKHAHEQGYTANTLHLYAKGRD